jgi:hypothetical protein
MKKVKTVKGMVIAQSKDGEYHIFTKDEWSCGEGFRSEEWSTTGLNEAVEWARGY